MDRGRPIGRGGYCNRHGSRDPFPLLYIDRFLAFPLRRNVVKLTYYHTYLLSPMFRASQWQPTFHSAVRVLSLFTNIMGTASLLSWKSWLITGLKCCWVTMVWHSSKKTLFSWPMEWSAEANCRKLGYQSVCAGDAKAVSTTTKIILLLHGWFGCHWAASSPCSWHLLIRSATKLTKGMTTMVDPLSSMAAGSINSRLLPPPVGKMTPSRASDRRILMIASSCFCDLKNLWLNLSRRDLVIIVSSLNWLWPPDITGWLSLDNLVCDLWRFIGDDRFLLGSWSSPCSIISSWVDWCWRLRVSFPFPFPLLYVSLKSRNWCHSKLTWVKTLRELEVNQEMVSRGIV